MKRLYCFEASRGMYKNYYANQSGSKVPIFQGPVWYLDAKQSLGSLGSMLGSMHSLGSMLSGLFCSAMPVIKRGLAFLENRH